MFKILNCAVILQNTLTCCFYRKCTTFCCSVFRGKPVHPLTDFRKRITILIGSYYRLSATADRTSDSFPFIGDHDKVYFPMLKLLCETSMEVDCSKCRPWHLSG